MNEPTSNPTVPTVREAFSLKTRRLPLSMLRPWPGNAREHGPRNLESIRCSLEQFGQVEPLVVQDGSLKIIGGNGRLEAMRELGWTHADAVVLNLDDVAASALNIALNRSAELASWDFHLLGSQLRDLLHQGFDLEGLGWKDWENTRNSATYAATAARKLPFKRESKTEGTSGENAS